MLKKNLLIVSLLLTMGLMAACGSNEASVPSASSANMQQPDAQSSASVQSANASEAPASSSAQSSPAPAQSSSSAAASSDSSAASASSAASSAASAEPTLVFGTEGEGATFTLANDTGKAIRSLSAKATHAADFVVDIIPDGAEFANGALATIHLPQIEADNSSDIETRVLADIKIITTDNEEFILHQINVGDLVDPSLHISEGIAYLDYKSASTAETISTLETEKSWRASQEQAAQEPTYNESYEEQVYAEEPAYQEPVYYEEPAYQEPVYYEEPAAAGNDAAVGGGGEDACVPDLVLR